MPNQRIVLAAGIVVLMISLSLCPSHHPGDLRKQNISMQQFGGGGTFEVYKSNNVEYAIVEGSSMSCIHELTYSMGYDADMSSNNPYIWSIVYEIQDSIVV